MSNNAIILCSGVGRRMSPIPSCNKSLLPIRGSEPNVKRTCKLLYKNGIVDIVIAAHPDNASEFLRIKEQLKQEIPELTVIVKVVDKYSPNCNNIVSMQAVSHYIKDTYIIEGDQYLVEKYCDFIRAKPWDTSIFFTQKREIDDWAILWDSDGVVYSILKGNPDPSTNFCLAGISYISKKDSMALRVALSACKSKYIYWEEVIDLDRMKFLSYPILQSYSLEYDNIHDLVRKKLMKPQDIANLVDDNHEAQQLDSMTNTSYLVSIKGVKYVLRIPGYGTEKFVDRFRESTIDKYVYFMTEGGISPESTYYSNDQVKLTEYLESSEYHLLDSFKEFPAVLKTLERLHNLPFAVDESVRSSLFLDLEKELFDYESILGTISPIPADYWSLRDEVLEIVNRYPTTGLVHRDLVPRNILVSSSQDVKLIDWEYACVFNKYWDLASLACEYADEYDPGSLDIVVNIIYAIYPEVKIEDIYLWIAVVDFVWFSWSIAKTKLGDDVYDYGMRRYRRCKSLLAMYNEV